MRSLLAFLVLLAIAAAGCLTPSKDIVAGPDDFALLEIQSRYGSTYQIDLDKQIARVRVVKPMPLDFVELSDGVRRNNMGLGGFQFQANATVSGSTVRLEPTGQVFALAGAAPAEGGLAWRRFRVLEWEDPAKTRVEIVR
jgi:hypothetical protein